MALVFKAPVEFFASDLYPDRCWLTGRSDNLRHFDLQLPYLNAGVGAVLIPLRFNEPAADTAAHPPADPHETPPPDSTPSSDPDRPALPPFPGVPTQHLPLPQQKRSLLSHLWGSAIWLFLGAWTGLIFGGVSTGRQLAEEDIHAMAIGVVVVAVWNLIYHLFIRNFQRRRINRKAFHFAVAIAEPTQSERSFHRLLSAVHLLVNVIYWIMLIFFLAPRNYTGIHLGMGTFWIVWILFIAINSWRNRHYPLFRLYPKQRELEIRLPNARQDLYDELCDYFMRWKRREQFPTKVTYNVDADADDFPDVDSGSWDQGDRS